MDLCEDVDGALDREDIYLGDYLDPTIINLSC